MAGGDQGVGAEAGWSSGGNSSGIGSNSSTQISSGGRQISTPALPACLPALQYGLPPPAMRTPLPRVITFQRKRANRRVVNEAALLALLAEFGEVRVQRSGAAACCVLHVEKCCSVGCPALTQRAPPPLPPCTLAH